MEKSLLGEKTESFNLNLQTSLLVLILGKLLIRVLLEASVCFDLGLELMNKFVTLIVCLSFQLVPDYSTML